MNFRQLKGNNSAITDDTPIKLSMHNLTLAIYIQFKFHEIPSTGYLVMAEDGKKSLILRQLKGNNSAIIDNIPIKLHMHYLTMVIYIFSTFHDSPSIGYLVMAKDGKTDI